MDIETCSSPPPVSYEIFKGFSSPISSVISEPKRSKQCSLAQKVLESIKTENFNLIAAPYGQGKSRGVLQLLKARIRKDKQGIQALIISPTLEHATVLSDILYDTAEDVESLGQSFQICSGEDAAINLRKLQSQPEILIVTADNLALLSRSNIINLKNIETFVVEDLEDYTSSLDLQDVLGRLSQRATVIATVSTFDPSIIHDHLRWLKKPNLVFNFNCSELLDQAKQSFIHLNGGFDSVDTVFQKIVSQTKQKVVVLCNHLMIKEISEAIAPKLEVVQLDIADSISTRNKMLYGFRTGKSKVLITSSHFLNALSNIKTDIVVNIGVPERESSYLQRLAFSSRQSATLFTIFGQNDLVKAQKLMTLFEKSNFSLNGSLSGFQLT